MIRLSHVTKQFQAEKAYHTVIQDVSLHVPKGEIFGLVGESGAGKSTLLRICNGLLQPDSGEVFFHNKKMTKLSSKELRQLQQHTSMVFQNSNLLMNLTIEQNIQLPLVIQKRKSELSVDEVLSLVGLYDKKYAYPHQLSGGQQQRIAIARAIITQPLLLLLDEPTSALDDLTANAIMEVLQRIHQQFNMTIIVVTHQLALAQALCHRIGVMQQGRLVEEITLSKRLQPIVRDEYVSYVKEVLNDV